jgi:RHS repeat-associated protein
VEGRLIQWISADGSTTVNYGYDGEGQRFEMQVISGSTTTTTTYIGSLEEIQVVGSTTTKMVYFTFLGQRVAEDDNTAWYYPINDGLTSTTVVVNYAGVVAAQLFGPYGQTRWAGGTMPTSFGFTGQRSDSATGLNYYGARYYDPLSGCFTSADTVLAGLNRYAYVGDNPTTRTDPSGHSSSCRLGRQDCEGGYDGGDISGGPCPFGVENCNGVVGSNEGDGDPAIGVKKCGSLGEAFCSSGGSNVNACAGKSHCVILINGTNSSASDSSANGFGADIAGWEKWIDSIYALYGGDVGFILMEAGMAQTGANLIHETLQSLQKAGYEGSISLIGASAGAAGLFSYLNEASSKYSDDPIISSFVALDAPQQSGSASNIDFPGCLWDACIVEMMTRGVQRELESGPTDWDGLTYGAEQYVRAHHVRGLYEWTVNDPISSEFDGNGAWKTHEYPSQPGNAHTYIESNYPDSDVLTTLCPTCYVEP